MIDLDIQKFFDSVPRDLIIKAVAANTDVPWVVLYVKRWIVWCGPEPGDDSGTSFVGDPQYARSVFLGAGWLATSPPGGPSK